MMRFSITPRNKRPKALSQLIRDPRVRAAFKRAEREQGGALVLPAPVPKALPPAAAAALRPQPELEMIP